MPKYESPLTQNMRALRQAQHLSAGELAAYLGKALPTYRNYELGYYPIPDACVPLLAKKLGVTEAQLRGDAPLDIGSAGKAPEGRTWSSPGRPRETASSDLKPPVKKPVPEKPAPAEEKPPRQLERIQGTGTLFDEFSIVWIESRNRQAIFEYEEDPSGEGGEGLSQAPGEEEGSLSPAEGEEDPSPLEEAPPPTYEEEFIQSFFSFPVEELPLETPYTSLSDLGLKAFERAAQIPQEADSKPAPPREPEPVTKPRPAPKPEPEPEPAKAPKEPPKKQEAFQRAAKAAPREANRPTGPRPEESPLTQDMPLPKRRVRKPQKARAGEDIQGQLSFDLNLQMEEKPARELEKKPKQEPKPDTRPEEETRPGPAPKKRPRLILQNSAGQSLSSMDLRRKVLSIAPQAEVIYAKPGENRAYWTRGSSNGFVLLWE